MAFKPNYGMHRAERARAQGAKREEKLRLRQERSEERKAAAAAAADVAQDQGATAQPSADPRGETSRKD